MQNINVSNFRKDMFRQIENTIKYDEPITISTKEGNAVIISENEYESLIETLYLSSMPDVRKELLKGLNTPLADCVPEDEVEW